MKGFVESNKPFDAIRRKTQIFGKKEKLPLLNYLWGQFIGLICNFVKHAPRYFFKYLIEFGLIGKLSIYCYLLLPLET